MPVSEKWNQLSEAEWREFAGAWLGELRRELTPSDSEVGRAVVSMNFTAPPEKQWQFILLAVSLAESEEELGHIGAGPIEHLLGWHGSAFIDRVEEQAAEDRKFALAMTQVCRYKMADEVWSRVKALQGQDRNVKPGATSKPDEA